MFGRKRNTKNDISLAVWNKYWAYYCSPVSVQKRRHFWKRFLKHFVANLHAIIPSSNISTNSMFEK